MLRHIGAGGEPFQHERTNQCTPVQPCAASRESLFGGAARAGQEETEPFASIPCRILL